MKNMAKTKLPFVPIILMNGGRYTTQCGCDQGECPFYTVLIFVALALKCGGIDWQEFSCSGLD